MSKRKRWQPWQRAFVWAYECDERHMCAPWRRRVRDSATLLDLFVLACTIDSRQTDFLRVLRRFAPHGIAPGGMSDLDFVLRLQTLSRNPAALCERATRLGWDGSLPK